MCTDECCPNNCSLSMQCPSCTMDAVQVEKLDRKQIKVFLSMAISRMIGNLFSSMLANNEIIES